MSVTFQQEQLSLMTVYAIFCHVLIAVVLLEQTRSHFLSQACSSSNFIFVYPSEAPIPSILLKVE
ncbi:hypothetical protein [Allocoleopsis franciscana]|uniref:hypothetical protein n=1 Tax=Allocoleopsis franciscana TaxID=2886352 RepID=UPI000306BDDA|nr:hypothetical protein [Allocoleopsis franciscana]